MRTLFATSVSSGCRPSKCRVSLPQITPCCFFLLAPPAPAGGGSIKYPKNVFMSLVSNAAKKRFAGTFMPAPRSLLLAPKKSRM